MRKELKMAARIKMDSGEYALCGSYYYYAPVFLKLERSDRLTIMNQLL